MKNDLILIENKTFDSEREFYGAHRVKVVGCRFDGPADGESAFKECSQIYAEGCYMNLRYPFWHVHGLSVKSCELTELCRAALWYSDNIEINNSKLHGIKALRECKDVSIDSCDIISPEFGWSSSGVSMKNTFAKGEYFMLRAENLSFSEVELDGKYSFQYIKNSVFENCVFNTKDAFWHAENITVRNSVVNGEYLAWYSKGVTFENCKICGTQPLCYCKDLKLIDCEMIEADLSFEKSDVYAKLASPIVSIKNPASGTIYVPSVGEIILDDPTAGGKVVICKEAVL